MAKTGHPNFDYVCQGQWRGMTHNFSIVGNHSGTSFGQSDAQAFMEGEDSPYALVFAYFQAPSIVVVSSRYYDGQNSAPVFVNDYSTDNPAPAPLTALGTGLNASPSTNAAPLEVCCQLESEVGLSSTSKPVYNRKFLRGVPLDSIEAAGDSAVAFVPTTLGTAAVAKLGDGSLYGSRVYISPSARSANNWVINPQVSNRQVPRGRKRKATSSGSGVSAESLLEKAIALAGGTILAGA